MYFVEYYQVLKPLNLEPLSRREGRMVNASQLLKNHSRLAWKSRTGEQTPRTGQLSEEELINLIKQSAPASAFKSLAKIEKPPASVFHLFETLLALFGNSIKKPEYNVLYPWAWYRKALRTQIPKLVKTLPEQLVDGRVTEDNLMDALDMVSTFADNVVYKKEANDVFFMEKMSNIMNMITYADRLQQLYHPSK